MLRKRSDVYNKSDTICNSGNNSLTKVASSSFTLENEGAREVVVSRNKLSILQKSHCSLESVNVTTARLWPPNRIFLSDILKHPDLYVQTHKLFFSGNLLGNCLSMSYGAFSCDDGQHIQLHEAAIRMSASARELEPSEGDLTISNIFQNKAENLLMATLFCASEDGNVDSLKSLFEVTNIDLNTTNKHGETAVHMAASGGHVEVLEYLLAKGVDVSIKDKQGDGGIYWAARQGHTDIIRCLVEAGVCINTQNKSGETALHVAASYGYTAVVEYLCKSGADVNLPDNLGETPLHYAAWHGFVQIVRILCETKADLTLQNKEMDTALHCAAVRGNLDCVKILLEFGAPLNIIDNRGNTPLHLACHRHNSTIALLILNSGCEVDIVGKEISESALHCAAREGLLGVVQAICSLGVNVNILSTSGLTPLHVACKFGHIEIVRCLLIAGANLDIANKDGLTAEIMALAQGFTDIAQLLASTKGEKRLSFINQLKPLPEPVSRVKLKLLGSSGVGKTTLLESLKVGFLGSFFRRKSGAASVKQNIQSKKQHQFSLPAPLSYLVKNPAYTRGIEVQTVNITGAGEFSVWDFSGYEPYYMLYDYFLGDVNCIHVVLFSLEDSLEDRIAQVIFWLNFLKARLHSQLPSGYCGRQQTRAKVVLIASNADRSSTVCNKTTNGILTNNDCAYILEKVRTMFQHDLDICPTIFIMNTQQPSSPDMRAFKQELAKIKNEISKRLPQGTSFLSTVVAEMVEWRQEMISYPVLSWSQFVHQVRECVNPLASDADIRFLDRQLQLMGEIVYLHGHTDLVVINPHWLGTDVLGVLLSHERIIEAKVTGCFSLDEFQLMFPDTDSLTLLQVLEALELCTPCEVDGDIEYEFPCLNFVEALEGLWLRDEKLLPNPVYGGIRLHADLQAGSQLKYLFPRIQVFLRRSILSGNEEKERNKEADDSKLNEDENDPDLYQWHHGSKYCCSRLEGIMDMDKNEQYLEVKVRGPDMDRGNIFYFLEDFVNIIEQVVRNVCPGISMERYALSPSQLRAHGKVIRAYSPTELLRMQLENRSSVVLSGNLKENFKDIACFGSKEILEAVTLGMDLSVSHLTVHTQRLLSLLLDPPDAMGKDWCLLAVAVGLTDALPSLDSQEMEGHTISPTQRILNEWIRRCPDATVRQLVCHLKDIGRLDAVEVILRTGPTFKVLSFDDYKTDDSGVVH